MKLLLWSVKRDSVRSSHGNPCEVSRSQADHVLLTTSRDQVEVHQPWCPCYRSLTTEFRRSGGADGPRSSASFTKTAPVTRKT